MADESEKASAKDEGSSDKDESTATNSESTAAKDDGSSTNEGSSKKGDEVSARGLKLANGFLWFLAGLFAMNLFFGLHMHRHWVLCVGALVGLVAMIALRLRAKPNHRVSVVLMMVPAVLAIGGFEFVMSNKRPRDGTAALKRGLPFDSRGLFEVLRDTKKTDPTAQSFVIPRALLTHNLNAPRWADEALAHTVVPNWGVKVDGVQTLPFAGVSNRKTVFCNEGGYWATFDSDEHGFNNPKGIWGAPPLDVAILGDSYSQGACVPQDKITAAYVRQKFPKTLTFGMCANGPLMEYANFREFVVDLKPKIVLWVYYNNDLSDMNVETQSELLMRYVDDDNFKQNLAGRQAGIDKALDEYLDAVAPTAPAWPSGLESVGLTRQSTPLFMQDVVMREGHSSFAAFLRLDWFTNAISTRLLQKNFFAAQPRWDLFKKVLTKTRTTAETWGAKSYFVYLPDAFYMSKKVKMEEPNRKGVLDAAREAGMKIIDVHEVFMALPDPEQMRPHYEAHFTEEGFALVGKTINDTLTADGL